MRYSTQHKENTRMRLLDATGALVKKQGFAATGVDSLMATAGLTSGAFYSHFRSKSELLEAITEHELKRSIAMFSDKTFDEGMVAIDAYLNQAHVEHPDSGCIVPSLTPEIARANESTQQAFEQGVVALKDQIQHLVKDDAKAWSIMAQLVGAVMVARALPSENTRKALLNGVRQQVKHILEGAI
jgi:TetR/AcrR family transcriptional regulator, transcriptional repressor for nem operon